MITTTEDYAILRASNSQFYYGYEKTDDDGDWCFTVEHSGVEQMRIPSSELKLDKFEVTECLLTGIGMWLERTKILQ